MISKYNSFEHDGGPGPFLNFKNNNNSIKIKEEEITNEEDDFGP